MRNHEIRNNRVTDKEMNADSVRDDEMGNNGKADRYHFNP